MRFANLDYILPPESGRPHLAVIAGIHLRWYFDRDTLLWTMQRRDLWIRSNQMSCKARLT